MVSASVRIGVVNASVRGVVSASARCVVSASVRTSVVSTSERGVVNASVRCG